MQDKFLLLCTLSSIPSAIFTVLFPLTPSRGGMSHPSYRKSHEMLSPPCLDACQLLGGPESSPSGGPPSLGGHCVPAVQQAFALSGFSVRQRRCLRVSSCFFFLFELSWPDLFSSMRYWNWWSPQALVLRGWAYSEACGIGPTSPSYHLLSVPKAQVHLIMIPKAACHS